MLHVLQYLVGKSIARVYLEFDLTLTHCEVGGPKASGSSDSSGGSIGCRFRGRIYSDKHIAFMKGAFISYPRIGQGSVYKGRETDEEKVGKNDRYGRRYIMP